MSIIVQKAGRGVSHRRQQHMKTNVPIVFFTATVCGQGSFTKIKIPGIFFFYFFYFLTLYLFYKTEACKPTYLKSSFKCMPIQNAKFIRG